MIFGLAGGCVYAACFRVIVSWFPIKERGLAFGILLAGPSLGLTLANAFSPGLEAILGWRAVFKAMGGLALLWAFLVFGFMRENPSDAGRPVSQEGRPVKSGGFLDGTKFVLKDYNLLLLSLGGFCYIWAFVGFVTWGNTYLKDVLKISLIEAGGIMSAMAIISLILAPLAGLWAGGKERSRIILMVASVILIVAVIFFGQTASVTLLWCLSLAVGVTCGFFFFIYRVSFEFYTPREWAGAAGGVTACIWQIAGMLSPLVSGGVGGDGDSFGLGWVIIAAGPLVGLVLLSQLGKNRGS